MSRVEFSFYQECCNAFRYFLWVKDCLLSSQKAFYQVLVNGAAQGDLIEKQGHTKQEYRSTWPWATGLKCFNNVEASLT